MSKKPQVVVTGGAGYVGSILVPLLLDAGYRVTVYDLLTYGITSLLHVAHYTDLTIVRGDVCDASALKNALKDANSVIHLAAVVGFPACDKDPVAARKVNVEGTRCLVSLLQPGQKLVYASTGSCYGAVDGICTEETPINPLTLYGETKAEGERLALEAGGVAPRLATVFGVSPRMRLDLLINHLTLKALTDTQIDIYEGHVMRTFLHVKDAAKAFVFALDHYVKMHGESFNVGDESMNISKGVVAELIRSKVKDCTISVTFGEDPDKRNYEVCYKKMRNLGYSPTWNLDRGITELMRVLPYLSFYERAMAKNI